MDTVTKKNKDDSFVYVIGPQEGAQKIGVAKDPEKRIITLQTSHPLSLAINISRKPPLGIRAIDVERTAHHLLAKKRTRGEWFSVSPEEAGEAIERSIKLIAENNGERPKFGGLAKPKRKEGIAPRNRLPGLNDYQIDLIVTHCASDDGGWAYRIGAGEPGPVRRANEALTALKTRGFLRSEDVKEEGRPARVVFRLTDLGRAVVAADQTYRAATVA